MRSNCSTHFHHAIFSTLILILLTSPAFAEPPATQPAVDQKTIDESLSMTGELKDGVYTITAPRTDIHLSIDGADVPTAAGIESRFHFYTCPCGKTRVIGEFVLCDYESDDVIDALRDGFLISVDAIAPMLTDDRPRLRIVRFHGEGTAADVAERIRNALGRTGEARMQKNTKSEPKK